MKQTCSIGLSHTGVTTKDHVLVTRTCSLVVKEV